MADDPQAESAQRQSKQRQSVRRETAEGSPEQSQTEPRGLKGLLLQGGTYLLVGASTALLELVLFQVLYLVSGEVPLANIVAVCVATALNFALNGIVTFKASSHFLRSLVLYLLLFALNTAFSTLAIGWLVGIGVHSLLAKLGTMGCIVCWNFVLYKKVVFA